MAYQVTAPMIGKVVKVLVKEGDRVEEDQPVVTIEAMKVEMPIVTPVTGKVVKINCSPGQTVEADTVLVEVVEE